MDGGVCTSNHKVPKKKAAFSLVASGNTHQTTQSHIPKNTNPKQQRYEKFKSPSVRVLKLATESQYFASRIKKSCGYIQSCGDFEFVR